MRQYQKIWIELKEKLKIQIEVPRGTHETVMQMLRRESALDSGYRFKCVEADKSYTISFTQIGDLLQISLEFVPYVPPSFVITPEKVERRKSWNSKYVAKPGPEPKESKK